MMREFLVSNQQETQGMGSMFFHLSRKRIQVFLKMALLSERPPQSFHHLIQ